MITGTGKYRVVRRLKDKKENQPQEFAFAVHQAYYEAGREEEKPRFITMYPAISSGDSIEHLRELLLAALESATDEPVLEWEDFFEEKPKSQQLPT